MNFGSTFNAHSVRLSLGITTALAAAWTIEPFLPDSGPMRLLVPGGCLLVIVALLRFDFMHHSFAERTAKRYIEMLCRMNHHDLSEPQVLETLPKLAAGNAWGTIFAHVRDRLIECGKRADESEHSWTACEVRLRRIENEHAQLREILDRVTDPILTVNHYDELTWVNQAGRDLFGIVANSDDGRTLQQTLSCKPLVDLLSDARRRKNASQRNAELEITDPSGNKRWFRLATRSLNATPGEEPTVHGALAVLTDISAEKGIQQRHAEFVSSAAHEMKTPLASIRAYVELLQDSGGDDPANQEEFLEVISTQADRLQRLIENLLNLARIEAGVVKVEKNNLSLNELLEHAFHVVQPSAEQKPLELVKDLSPLHLGVFVDKDMAVQAAINLLSNAVKYTPANGKITLRSRLDDNAVVFEVEDTGVGLTPEDCKRVFERFYRVKKDQQMAAGTGLGLSLVKHIVEDVHGGTIAVASQLGKGSVFRVTLPAVCRTTRA